MTTASVEDFLGWSPSFRTALSRLSIASRRPAGSPYPGDVRSRILGRAIEFADYRPYVAGDELGLVDWRVYARSGRMYVKRQQEERERTLTLLIDTSASHDFGEGDAHKGRFARRLASALAWIALAGHEPVRTYLLHDGRADRLSPCFALNDSTALFRALSNAHDRGDTRLSASVAAALARTPQGPVVLLSDLLEPEAPGALSQLARHESTVLRLLAPEEWEPALGDELELEDSETGERLAVRIGPAELAGYKERLQQHLDTISAEARRQGIVHVALRTDTPFTETVLRRLPAAGVLTA